MVMDVEAWVRRQASGAALTVAEASFVFAVDGRGAKRPLPEPAA